jgi:hypothetical protein
LVISVKGYRVPGCDDGFMGCKGAMDASHFSAGEVTLQGVEASPLMAGRMHEEHGTGRCGRPGS